VLALGLALGGLAQAAGVFSTLAGLPGLWPAVPLARIVADHPGCAVLVAGYAEPSVIFLTGNRVRFVSVPEAQAALTAPGCRVVALPSAEAPGQPVARIAGLNIGNGQPLALSVFVTP
jgi:hypothetical protein